MPDATLPETLLKGLIRTYAPQRIVLFGSHARGDAGPDSDLDLLILLDDDAPEDLLGWRRRYDARRGHDGPVDILPCRAGVFAARARVPGSLAAAIQREGIVVYERH